MESAGQLLVAAISQQIAQGQLEARSQFRDNAEFVQEQFIGIIPLMKRAIAIFILFFLMLGVSAFTYGVFYFVIMPRDTLVKPLYFDYSGKGSSNSGKTIECDSEAVCFPPVTELQAPTARVDLFAQNIAWEALEQEVLPPNKHAERHALKQDQEYFLEIALNLPETNLNQFLGMFTVGVELRSRGRVIATSIRSTRFPYESSWLSTLRKLVLLVPLMLGALSESRTVTVAPFNKFVESPRHPLQRVVVRLNVPHTRTPQNQNGHVEVVSGELRIGKELNRLQTLMKDWFFTCFFLGTALVFFANLSFLVCCRLLWKSRSRSTRSPSFVDSSDFHYQPQQDLDNAFTHQQDDSLTDVETDGEWQDMPAHASADDSNIAHFPDEPTGNRESTSSPSPQSENNERQRHAVAELRAGVLREEVDHTNEVVGASSY